MSMDAVGIVVVHVGIFVFWQLMRWLRPLAKNRAFLGYYLVLMPLGLTAWDDPLHWLDAGLAMMGLVVLTLTVAAARE